MTQATKMEHLAGKGKKERVKKHATGVLAAVVGVVTARESPLMLDDKSVDELR